ncbi:hypothetical protein PtB15_3B12 [Puccinia triticina]|nr:hypothetical protein PtB15_3B12 [Puccinia triticina]
MIVLTAPPPLQIEHRNPLRQNPANILAPIPSTGKPQPINLCSGLQTMANRSNRLTANANKTDDFFMVTRRVSVNRDAPDNPPTGNAPDATQESVLGPSQAGIPEGQSCRLFHEPEGSDDGNAANGSQLPPDASGSNPTATPNGENPPPVAGAAPSGPAMTGRPAHSATNSHPRVNPPTSPDRSAGLQPAQRAPEPDPGLAARVFTPARGPSTPGARVVSPARRSLSGRFLPARVGPQATPTGAGTRTPSDAAHSPVTRRGSHATTALPLVPSPSPLGSPAAAPGANLDAVAGAPDAGPGAETDELESIQPDAPHCPTPGPSSPHDGPQAPAGDSTEVKTEDINESIVGPTPEV